MTLSPLANKEKLQAIINVSINKLEVLAAFNLTASSGNYKTLNKYLRQYEITGFLKARRKRQGVNKSAYTNERCFTLNSDVSRVSIKSKIIKQKLIPYICCVCNLGDVWNNKKLVLQLEHLNGVNDDNRLENLAFICPNCHSQTDTYAGKNKNKKL